MSIINKIKEKRKEILAPTGGYHKMDGFILEDNPHPYLRIEQKEVDPRKIAPKISFWKSLCHILFFPFFKWL